MQKTIWTCWFQGRRNAPDLVQKCISSWEALNPGWEVRCLDASTVGLYLDLAELIDLNRQSMTAATLSDLVRILLLHEYGGVWVDATLYCNQPLDTWLPSAIGTGFFAFDKPTPDRLLASWFLAREAHDRLVPKWATRAVNYWRERTRSDDYFWFHHEFGELCAVDDEARAAWDRVPKISADGPHSVQAPDLLYRPAATVAKHVDWTLPVFKLTYRFDANAYRPGCLLDHILNRADRAAEGTRERESQRTAHPLERMRSSARSVLRNLAHPFRSNHSAAACARTIQSPRMRFAGLKVDTENLGDHIQLIAANRLLARLGIVPEFLIDRDNEVASSARLNLVREPVGVLLNGWFKTNPAEWPPHPKLTPIYLGFHIRLFQSPSLVSDEALRHYRAHGPIGCRDVYTVALLQRHGVDAFLSNCVSLLLPRRLEDDRQNEIFVVSRDERILEYLPDHLHPYVFIKQYSGSSDFDDNMQQAAKLLDTYRSRAKLIVTTLLHCALPAIAMGIPVVVFYPINPAEQHKSDRERFSSIERMIRVYSLTESDTVDWQGRVVDVSYVKLGLLDALYRLAARWDTPGQPPLGPIASPDALPVPSG